MRKEDANDMIPRGALQLSRSEAQVLLDVIVSTFHFANSLGTDVPSEIKAIRSKLNLLRDSLINEEKFRDSIVDEG